MHDEYGHFRFFPQKLNVVECFNLNWNNAIFVFYMCILSFSNFKNNSANVSGMVREENVSTVTRSSDLTLRGQRKGKRGKEEERAT